MTTISIIIVTIYVLSCIGYYKFVQNSYSKNGRWDGLTPDLSDIISMFLPLFNTIGAMAYFYDNLTIKIENFVTKFFKIKQ